MSRRHDFRKAGSGTHRRRSRSLVAAEIAALPARVHGTPNPVFPCSVRIRFHALAGTADQVDTGQILTLNRDFEVYRWRSRRTFELLIDLS